MINKKEIDLAKEFEEELEAERREGFISGVMFALLIPSVSFLAWFIVFAQPGWWIK